MPDIQTATHGPIDIDGLPLPSQPMLTGTPIFITSAGAPAGAVSITLPGTAGQTTYLEGFVLLITEATGLTAAQLLSISGLLGGTLSWPTPQQFTTADLYIQQNFPSPRPASATNTNIILSYPAVATGGTVFLLAWGFQA